MDIAEKYEHWHDIAEYDLKSAEAMYETSRWLYVVFMCQQAIEKLAKGLYVLYMNDDIPRIHNISQIIKKYADQFGEEVPYSRYVLFDKLTSFYLEGRYPEYTAKLSKLIDKDEAEKLLEQTKEAFAWLLNMKP